MNGSSKILRIAFVALAVVALAVFAGCEKKKSGSSSTAEKKEAPKGYPEEVRTTFITSCDEAGGTKTQCTELLDCIEPEVPFDKFKEADAVVQKTDKMPAWYEKVQDKCIEEIT